MQLNILQTTTMYFFQTILVTGICTISLLLLLNINEIFELIQMLALLPISPK